MEPPKQPHLFLQVSRAPSSALVLRWCCPPPDVTSKVDYEVELAVVIGKAAKNISVEQAMDHVYGYTILNDISARDLQFEDGQWVKGKALDTFAPLGPWIVTKDEIADPHNLRLVSCPQRRSDAGSNTSNLIFNIPALIAYLSRFFTLKPGDIIATGTPHGVGQSRVPPRFLKAGDTMVAEIEGIGALETPVVSAARFVPEGVASERGSRRVAGSKKTTLWFPGKALPFIVIVASKASSRFTGVLGDRPLPWRWELGHASTRMYSLVVAKDESPAICCRAWRLMPSSQRSVRQVRRSEWTVIPGVDPARRRM